MSDSAPPQYPDDSHGYGRAQSEVPSGLGSRDGRNSPASSHATGFFKALFDLSFNNFVTLSFAKLIYVIALVLIGIIWLVTVLLGFNEGVGQGFLALIAGSIVGLFYVVLVRVGLEFSVAMVRTAQNTSELVRSR
ncbi:DUF4282 domain-containing protein [Georgenia muralis]